MATVRLLTLDFYTLEELRQWLEDDLELVLDDAVRQSIQAGAEFVQRKAQEDCFIYGVNTGFGSLCETRVDSDEIELLQYNHVVSHACGVGQLVPEHTARMLLLIKLLTFRSGRTGISLPTVGRIVEMWNRRITPAIPRKGSVGASGDLAPLAHMSLPLLGLGRVYYRGEVIDSAEMLAAEGWQPLELKAKEGLALTNGVQYINSVAVESVLWAIELARCADLAAAMSIQAFSAASSFYHPRYHETSYHLERRTVAGNLRLLLDGSNHDRLPTCNSSQQDPYSFRCIPQVHGAIRQVLGFVAGVIENEVNGVSDNPLFFAEADEIHYGGNLHGESTALALDNLAIAISELSNISERRTYQLLSGSRGLPSFLVAKPGANSGFMIVQYTSAALLNENKLLASPASVDTIPTCQLQEDHVSMGATSAHKLLQILTNSERILATEMLIAAQAIDFNQGLELSEITRAVHQGLRSVVPFLDNDRVMSDDMETAFEFFAGNKREWSSSLGLS